MMALTATATKTLQKKISYILGMHLPKVIAVSPCKNNLMYAGTTHTSMRSTFMPLLRKLREEGTAPLSTAEVLLTVLISMSFSKVSLATTSLYHPMLLTNRSIAM